MVKLTLTGKIVIGAIIVLFLYFFIFPIVMNFFNAVFPSQKVERSREIKVVAFLKTFDRDSVKLQETLRKLEKDQNMKGMISLSMVNIEAEPGKMKQHNITSKEVPSFILGNKKYQGLYSSDWFKEKILSLSNQNKEKSTN